MLSLILLALALPIFVQAQFQDASFVSTLMALAYDHCSFPDDPLSREYFDVTADQIIKATQKEYGPYDFITNYIVKPVSPVTPEAMKNMMRACLAQRAALHFTHTSIVVAKSGKQDGDDGWSDSYSVDECAVEAFEFAFTRPLLAATPFLDTQDFAVLPDLLQNTENPCLAQASSSLARKHIYSLALKEKPAKPSIIDYVLGIRQFTQVLDVNELKDLIGANWVSAWLQLKNWRIEEGSLQGWTIDEAQPGRLYPVITVYYLGLAQWLSKKE